MAHIWLVSEDSLTSEGEEFEPATIEEFDSLRDAKQSIGRYLYASQADEYPIRNPRALEFHDWNDGTREFYEQGISRDRTLHFPACITRASRLRVCRLFGLRT